VRTVRPGCKAVLGARDQGRPVSLLVLEQSRQIRPGYCCVGDCPLLRRLLRNRAIAPTMEAPPPMIAASTASLTPASAEPDRSSVPRLARCSDPTDSAKAPQRQRGLCEGRRFLSAAFPRPVKPGFDGLHSRCTPAPSNSLNMLMGHGPLKAGTAVRIRLGPPVKIL
jgi:hypothetical protein